MQPNEWGYALGSLAAVLLGIVVLGVLRVVSGPDEEARDDPVHLVLGIAGRVLIAAGLLAAVTPAAILFWPVLIVVLFEGLSENRRGQQQALLATLATAAERSIPLAPAVEAFAQEQGGLVSGRAARFAALLQSGVPLPEALRRSPRLLPPEALPLVHVGFQAGDLAAAFRQAAVTRHAARTMWQPLVGRCFYLCWLAIFALMIVVFVNFQIIPSFVKIYGDFHTELPAITQAVFGVGQRLVALKPLFIFYQPIFAALNVVLVFSLKLLLLYGLLRYMGWIRWDLPGMGRMTRRLDTALMFEAMALAAEHARPLPETIDCLAQTYPKRAVRRRLARAAADVRSGADWCETLRARGLMQQADLAILQAAERVGNLPWALREMADSNRRRLAYRIQAITQLLFPPVVLIFGLAVLFFVLGIFMPLVALIQRLA